MSLGFFGGINSLVIPRDKLCFSRLVWQMLLAPVFKNLLLCVCECEYARHGTCVEVGGRLVGVGVLLCGVLESDSGRWVFTAGAVTSLSQPPLPIF